MGWGKSKNEMDDQLCPDKNISIKKKRKSPMKKQSLLISMLLSLSVLLAQGCSNSNLNSKIDHDCPYPPKENLINGHLKPENGVTLKCQVKNFTNRISCIEIIDEEDEGLFCSNGSKKALFVFDKNDILKNYKFY